MGIPPLFSQLYLDLHTEASALSHPSLTPSRSDHPDPSSLRRLIHFATLTLQQLQSGFQIERSLRHSVRQIYGEETIEKLNSLGGDSLMNLDVTTLSNVSAHRFELKRDVSHLLSPPSHISLSLSQSALRRSLRESVSILTDTSRHLSAQLLSFLLLPFAQNGDWRSLLGYISSYVEKYSNGIGSVPVSLLCWMVSPDPNDPLLFKEPYPALRTPFIKGDMLTSPITGISLDVLGSTLVSLVAEGASSDLDLLSDAIDSSVSPIDAVLSFSESFTLGSEMKKKWILPLRRFGDQILCGSRALKTLSGHHLTFEIHSDWKERASESFSVHHTKEMKTHLATLDPASSPQLFQSIFGRGIHLFLTYFF